jgi:hypothetical protein
VLIETRFVNTDLSASRMSGAKVTDAQFLNCNLSKAEWRKTDLAKAEFRHVNFSGTRLDDVDFSGVRYIRKNTHLETAESNNVRTLYNDSLLPVHERIFTWEAIRKFGQMPLFLASYLGLLLIPLGIDLLHGANLRIEFGREWAAKILSLPAHPDFMLAEAIQSSLTDVEPPLALFFLLIGCLFTAVASTLYTLFCPDKIKSFSRAQWESDVKGHLIQYSPLTWKHSVARKLAMTCYALGLGTLIITIFANFVWVVVSYLLAS